MSWEYYILERRESLDDGAGTDGPGAVIANTWQVIFRRRDTAVTGLESWEQKSCSATTDDTELLPASRTTCENAVRATMGLAPI